MERLTQQLLLVLLGGITLRVGLTDDHLAYVQAGFRPLLVLAGAVLLALGAVGLVRDWPRARPEPEPDPRDERHERGDFDYEHEHEHEHEHGPPRIAWLLVLPVAVLLLISPPALGAYTAERQAQAVVLPGGAELPPLQLGPDDEGADHRTMTLLDYSMYALSQDTSALQRRTIRLIGFVVPHADGGWSIGRFRISCCAADGVPILVSVDGDRGDLQADRWIELIGTWGPATTHPGGGYREPVVVLRSVSPIEPPSDPYETW